MFRRWNDDEERARVGVARWYSVSTIVVALSLGVVLLGGIKGCTDYNIERVKHPVKYEQIDTFERGGNN